MQFQLRKALRLCDEREAAGPHPSRRSPAPIGAVDVQGDPAWGPPGPCSLAH